MESRPLLGHHASTSPATKIYPASKTHRDGPDRLGRGVRHDELAPALSDFRERWSERVDELVDDGQ